MKFQLAILLIFALIICEVVSAESEKTTKTVGTKKFNRHGNKMNRPERNMESRSRFPRRLQQKVTRKHFRELSNHVSSWNFPLKINQFAVWPFVSKPGSSSYDSSNHNYFNDYDHGNKMNRPERNMESRSRFPRRLQHGNGGFGTTSRMAMNRPGPR